MKIKCIGKKRTMINSWSVYKMTVDKKEYLIENVFHPMKILSYNELNEFELVDKYDFTHETIETKLRDIKKIDKELNDEQILKHFTITEAKEIVPIIMKQKIFTDDEINTLFSFVDEWQPVTFGSKMLNDFIETEIGYRDLTYSQEQNIKQHCTNIVYTLESYTATMKVKGDHRNDGQMVDYTMVLKSPDGEKTRIETSRKF